MVSTFAPVSLTQSNPVSPTSKKPSSTYFGISWGRSSEKLSSRGSSTVP
jgi:hypothetical protein